MKIVMLCGGHGTRLWPISRKSFPKPFVPLVNGKSFVQITYARYRKVYSPEDIFISTEERYLSFVRKQLPEVPKKNIILEPERKDTLAAYGLAVAVVHKYYPGEPVLISWSKHIIKKESVFLNAVAAAAEFTQSTGLGVSIDSKPDFPSVNNGWIKKGKLLNKINGSKIYEMQTHKEKPVYEVAKQLFDSGDWLIHTGFKVWNSTTLLGYFEKYQPEMYKGLKKITDALGTKDYNKVLNREYSKFTETSMDFGILEKLPSGSLVTLEADMGWLDVGISWETFFHSFLKKDNVIEGGGDIQLLDSENNLVIGHKGKMIGLVGVKDLAIIDTPDGLLVCKITETHRVKELYALIEKNNEEYTD